MVAGVENILSAAQQRQLIALKNTARSLDGRQLNLASGLDVNSARDNPQNFFASRALKFRSSDLARLLDGIGRSVQTIKMAESGLEGAESILEQAYSYLTEVEQDILSGEITFEETVDTSTPDNVTEITFGDPSDLQGYAGAQDGVGVVSLINGGDGVSLDGNLWKKFQIDYDVTADTVLEFDFRSTNIPEIAAIGFDNDNNFSNSNDQFFLYGTQFGGIPYSAPIPTYQYDGSGDYVHVEIPIGTYFTGTFSHITFINDDDGGGDDGDSQYLDIFLREGPLPTPPTVQTGPQKLEDDYAHIIEQLDLLVLDSSYRGINLLGGDDRTTYFNELRTSSLVTEGIDATSAGLGLTQEGFDSLEDVRLKIEEVRAARETIRQYASSVANDLNIIKNREFFTKALINTLEEGGDKLILADQNEEGAKLLALQTRQQIQLSVLSIRDVSIANFI